MSGLKRAGLIIVLIGVGLLDIFIYWNSRLYHRAGNRESPAEKVSLLERSNIFYPLNDRVFYELGKSYFDLAIENLDDAAASLSYFQKSVQNLKKSISRNPASPFAHFHLAQSLLHLEFISSENGAPIFEEFRKSALLAGENSQIFSQVGRVFLSRWPDLSEKDRSFTLGLLRKILARNDREEMARILNTWEMNAQDCQIMEKILPDDAQSYRQYAEFLGEKSFSIEERHKYFVRAELLDFNTARSEIQTGEKALSRFWTQEAFARFRKALNLIRGIVFFQSLTASQPIDIEELSELKKSLFLNLAKCRIEKGQSYDDFAGYLGQYLSVEDQSEKIAALESYLKNREVIPPELEESPGDLDRLVFELLLFYKQSKYDEIIDFARGLERRYDVPSKANKKYYVRILQIAGDSLQQTGGLHEAGRYYQNALQMDPMNLDTLFRIRENDSRLNEEKRLFEVNTRIKKVLTPEKLDFKNLTLGKGKIFEMPLVLEGQDILLNILFERKEEGINPLISVLFNDRVVWDEYSPGGNVAVVLGTNAGKNILQITSVNCPISLIRLIYRTASADET